MPNPGKHHRHAMFIRRLDHLIVSHGTTGLYHSTNSNFGGGIDPVAEREKCIGRHHGLHDDKTLFRCLHGRDPCTYHSTHLTSTHTNGTSGTCENDGVGLDVLDGAPAEKHGLEFVLAWVTLGDDFEIGGGGLPEVALLHKERLSADGADVPRHDVGRVEQQPGQTQVFLLLQQLECVRGEVGSDDDLGEISLIALAVARSSAVLQAMMPPNGACRSVA